MNDIMKLFFEAANTEVGSESAHATDAAPEGANSASPASASSSTSAVLMGEHPTAQHD